MTELDREEGPLWTAEAGRRFGECEGAVNPKRGRAPAVQRGPQAQPFFAGTFAPFLRALDRPMATACLGLVTFLPDLPLFSFPCFISRIASWTSSWALGP